MAADAFKDLNWSAAYGGTAWAAISQGYIDLRKALDNYNPQAPSPTSESAEKLIAAIDHAFDLEHNTGTVLNKVKYFDEGGYDWIKKALDEKRDSNMYVIASKASSDMRKLGHEVLKVAGMQDKQLKNVSAEAGIPKTYKKSLKKEKLKVGDQVKISPVQGGGEGVITKLIPNKIDKNNSVAFVKLTKNAANFNQGEEIQVNFNNLEKINTQESSQGINVGDEVEIGGTDIKGTVEQIDSEGSLGFKALYLVKVTSSPENKDLVGKSTWYNKAVLKKIEGPKPIKLKGFNKLKETKPTEFEVGNHYLYKNIYGNEYIVELLKKTNILNKSELTNFDLVKLEVLKVLHQNNKNKFEEGDIIDSNTSYLFSIENETKTTQAKKPKFKVGDFVVDYQGTVGKVVKVHINENGNRYYLALVTRNRDRDMIGNEYWWAERSLRHYNSNEADSNNDENLLEVGAFCLMDNEKFVVQVEEIARGIVKFKILGASNTYKRSIGQTNRMPKDMFEDRVDFFIPRDEVDYYIEKLMNKPSAGSPPPEERRRYKGTLKPGNVFVIDKNFLVQITKVKENSIFYKILATTKQYKHLEGWDIEKALDVFADNINFMVRKSHVPEYIKYLRNMR